MKLLQIENIHTFLSGYHILQGVSLSVNQGEVTVLLGRNGAGKTTTIRSILGLSPISSGSILYKNKPIHSLPTYKISNLGIGYVPENQGIFSDLTVGENLTIAFRKKTNEITEKMEWMLEIFPDLKTYWNKKGGLLSGGQKQMLAIARAYLNNSECLLIDEPSKGLAPIMVEALIEAINQMKKHTTILLVEQNFFMASQIGHTFYLMDNGKTTVYGTMDELARNDELKQKYLGIS